MFEIPLFDSPMFVVFFVSLYTAMVTLRVWLMTRRCRHAKTSHARHQPPPRVPRIRSC